MWYLLASSKTRWHLFASLKFGLNCLYVELDHLKSSKFWCHLLTYLNFEWCHLVSLKSGTHHFIPLKSIIARSQCTSIAKMPKHVLRLLHRQLLHCKETNAHHCMDKLHLQDCLCLQGNLRLQGLASTIFILRAIFVFKIVFIFKASLWPQDCLHFQDSLYLQGNLHLQGLV